MRTICIYLFACIPGCLGCVSLLYISSTFPHNGPINFVHIFCKPIMLRPVAPGAFNLSALCHSACQTLICATRLCAISTLSLRERNPRPSLCHNKCLDSWGSCPTSYQCGVCFSVQLHWSVITKYLSTQTLYLICLY